MLESILRIKTESCFNKVLLSLQMVFGFPASDVHLIGHSLGAHMSGLVGTYMKDVLGTSVGRSVVLAGKRVLSYSSSEVNQFETKRGH